MNQSIIQKHERQQQEAGLKKLEIQTAEQQMRAKGFDTVEVKRKAVHDKKDRRAPVQIRACGCFVLAIYHVIESADNHKKKIVKANFARIE